jgi:hypothetical protein
MAPALLLGHGSCLTEDLELPTFRFKRRDHRPLGIHPLPHRKVRIV